MSEVYISEIDNNFNISIPQEVVEKFNLKGNNYVKFKLKRDSVEMEFVRTTRGTEKLEGAIFLPEN